MIGYLFLYHLIAINPLFLCEILFTIYVLVEIVFTVEQRAASEMFLLEY